jgi:hypothetical protein
VQAIPEGKRSGMRVKDRIWHREWWWCDYPSMPTGKACAVVLIALYGIPSIIQAMF